jgi:hypothetical protein
MSAQTSGHWLLLLSHPYVALPLASMVLAMSWWQRWLIYTSTGATWLILAIGLLACIWLAVIVF